MKRTTLTAIVALALTATAAGVLIGSSATAAGETPKAWGAGTSAYINDFQSATWKAVLKRDITASGDGVLAITGTLSAEDDCSLGGQSWLAAAIALDANAVWDAPDFNIHPDICNIARQRISILDVDSVAVTATIPVTAGDHTVKLMGQELGGGSYITSRGLTIVFLPAGTGPMPWPTPPPV
jgi:hypothetical protein